MNKICWITPDCFLDVDMSIVPKLTGQYKIHWIILFGVKNNRFAERDFEGMASDQLSIEFFYNKYRERNPKTILYYRSIKKSIKRFNPDLIYCDDGVGSPFAMPFLLWIARQRCVFTVHQGDVHGGMDHRKLIRAERRMLYNRVSHVHMFSKSQAEIFHNLFPKVNIFQTYLGLKTLGEPTVKRTWNKDKIHFLVFGTINRTKHIDLLIGADMSDIVSLLGSFTDRHGIASGKSTIQIGGGVLAVQLSRGYRTLSWRIS